MNYFLLALIALLLIPSGAFAATKPSCEIITVTMRGVVYSAKTPEVMVREGEVVGFLWFSENATSARDDEGNPSTLAGAKVVKIDGSTSFSYEFSNGDDETTCSVGFHAVDGEISANSLVTEDERPTIKGTADGTETVKFSIEDSDGKRLYLSKELKVRSGKWSERVSKELPDGNYLVTLYGDKDYELNSITTGMLALGPEPEKGKGSITVSQFSLLTGGTAAAGTSIPIEYLKVVNTSQVPVKLEGFTLKETGSAPDDLVIGFTTNDDKGGSRSTIGGTEGTELFKNSQAFVPLIATIEPSQIRIFTIKAIVSRTSGSSGGKQLLIDTVEVKADGAVKASYPIRGVTWTLAY
ncbi:MAG: hypothetical protein KBD05_01205 [Candidatus Pacebacteria bacterium]|nr:hypothetical protein [Candidatus Paceibacterota bacterium]